MKTSILTKNQKRIYGPKTYRQDGNRYSITATVRYDDQCGNGHNSFSITADIRENGLDYSSGCCHDEVAKHFPELAPLIKWHLFDANGPMHYLANTIYHASARDHNGLLKGEKKQLVNGRTKQKVWELIIRDENGEMVKGGHSDWVDSEEKPVQKLSAEFEPVWIHGEGKEIRLDYARSCAVWPDATDEELTAPGLKERLEARLPTLIEEFKTAVESLGFIY